MKVSIQSTYGGLNFKGTNERGQSIQLSGNKEAVSPMESVLMAAASCSAIDIETLLKKMRQEVSSIEVEVDAVRADAVPAVFVSMHLHYIVTGDVKEDKAIKAAQMSLEQYCSVSLMLSKSVKITHSVEVRISNWGEEI